MCNGVCVPMFGNLDRVGGDRLTAQSRTSRGGVIVECLVRLDVAAERHWEYI